MPQKAYKNLDFLSSQEARSVRILTEYLEPRTRFAHYHVRDTVVFFGSARALPPERAAELLAHARQSRDPDAQRRAESAVLLARYYDDCRELAHRLTLWSKSLQGAARRFIVCSGGGPGIMEAANRGASEAHGISIGLGISLPSEPAANPYITRELGFEFHYFFMRKFWLVYPAKALVVFPGGFGTMDELFELLTLVQTRKIQKRLPIVLYGEEFWRDLLHLDTLVRWGTISPEDLALFRIIDSVDEAFDHLKTELTELYLEGEPASGETLQKAAEDP
ncbi:MAG TPA: LOG family protein [Candidatus Polarisedimenticolaceae bacterium]|nr:LOG family protein [Candidatus Polarisedimenticolaceae bacterium]